jgi:hypothetical protein
VILGRLRDTLRDIPRGAIAARMALGDVAYPRSQAELDALGGFALLLVTALAHDEAELPIDGAVAKTRTAVAPLPLVASRASTVTDDIGAVLGSHRHDAVYLLPVFATRVPMTVVISFRGGNRSLDLLRFPPPPEADPLPRELDLSGEMREPLVQAIDRLLQDELPLMKDAQR